MKYLKEYNNFLVLEKFDDNIVAELRKMGVTDEDEINTCLYHAHRGNLAKHLTQQGKRFTFGMLNAMFKDARDAKRKTELKTGIIKAVHRIVPMALAPFFPVVAIVGYILGTSRAFNKVIAPILADPGNTYPDFLKKLIDGSMRIAEGDLTTEKDRFTRAFVVSDRLVDAIKPQVLQNFSLYMSEKMTLESPDMEVPEHYIENQLKSYLNDRFGIDPEIPMKQ